MKKGRSLFFVSFFLFASIFLLSGCADKKTESESKDDSKFYTIDEIAENGVIGNSIFDSQTYKGLVVGKATLEGIIGTYGLPTHVIGAKKGDSNLEATWDSNEYKYSIGLKFKKKTGNYGDWVLDDKYVVETAGIDFSEYTPITQESKSTPSSEQSQEQKTYTEEEFEKSLNDGKDMEGKVVKIKIQELVPDSAFGYNLYAGQHLNFVSEENPKLNKDDEVTVKAEKIKSVLGSWIIEYSLIK